MKYIYLFLLANLITTSLFATHNKAGEIHYVQIGEKTIQCIIITYTEPSSIPADRDSLEINFGDGTSDWVLRSNGDGNVVNPRYKHNIYSTQHTYSSFGEYTLSVDDRNRNDGIININNGNSSKIGFHIFNSFTLNGENNSSPQSLLPPVAVGSVFTPFEHIATAFDSDGDKLTYKLVTPKDLGGEDIEGYQEVTDFNNGGASQISINPINGYLVWETPEIAGQYNIAIEITSWRNGEINGIYIRDMVIEIENTPIPSPLIVQTDLPPFASIQEVFVGDTVQLLVSAVGQNNFVSLDVKSGLLELDENPANFVQSTANESEQIGTFLWIVEEAHFREEVYDIAIQISDDRLASGFYLVSFKVNDIDTSTPFLSETNHDINLYPNPAQDILTIESQSRTLSTFQIFNMMGKVVSYGHFKGNKIDISALTMGAYILLIDQKYTLSFNKVK